MSRAPPAAIVPLAQDQRWALARGLLHDDGHDLVDRVAGLLVLLFGQRPGKISGLTTGSVGLDGGLTILTLGTTPIRVPKPLAKPLATLLHQLVRQRRHLTRVPAGGRDRGCSPACTPDRPILPTTISHRLARVGVDTVTGRAGALLQLAGELPPTVLADLLGLRPKTAVAWSQLAGRPWGSHPAFWDSCPPTFDPPSFPAKILLDPCPETPRHLSSR